MALLEGFPDIESAVCSLLIDVVDGLTADTVTPAEFKDKLPFARVMCHGGGDNRITDTSRITVDYFAATGAAARAGAETVRQFLTQEGGHKTGSTVIDHFTTDSKPQDIPWNDANSPRRFVASYRATARR